MQLTRFTDYGLRILLHLSRNQDGHKDSLASLAELYNMNHHHVNKVSQKMAALGWISSTRGKAGGISLQSGTRELSIETIVTALETNLEPIDCYGVECPIAGQCRLQTVFDEASNAFMEVLKKYRLSDMSEKDLSVIKILSDN
jgi:Rrf2 family nitric oxide-sensitive transcriptional repressor